MHGIERIQSSHSAEETVSRIEGLLSARGVKLFAVIDHSGEAAAAGFQMPYTRLLIFGNPAGGTPIMLAAPSSALDLPLKLLVSEEISGEIWISWNTAEYLRDRHGIREELLSTISLLGNLAAQAAAK